MRITYLSAFLLLPHVLSAQQTIMVTPQMLADWTVVGSTRSTISKQSDLALPAGVQLARSFGTGDLSLQLTTRPIIGFDESEWPVVELGSAALLLGRDSRGGKLLLALGNEAPIELPLEFALDAMDQSADLLTIDFARQGSTVIVGLSGSLLKFSAMPEKGGTMEIVASAGATHPWTLQSLTVTTQPVATQVFVTPDSPTRSAVFGKNSSQPPNNPSPTPAESRLREKASSSAAGALIPASTKSTVASAPEFQLEIFIPSAIRHGRADVIRMGKSNLKTEKLP